MAVVSWLEWVGLVCLEERRSAVDAGRTAQMSNHGRQCPVRPSFEPQTRWDSDLVSPLAPASNRPPNHSWCPVSLLCCPRSLLLLTQTPLTVLKSRIPYCRSLVPSAPTTLDEYLPSNSRRATATQ